MSDHYGHHIPKNLPVCYADFYCRFQRQVNNHRRYSRHPRCKWKGTCNQKRNHPWFTMEEWVTPHLTEETAVDDVLERALW